MSNFDEVAEKISSFLKSEVSTKHIIGKQFTPGEFICVPVDWQGMGRRPGREKIKATKRFMCREVPVLVCVPLVFLLPAMARYSLLVHARWKRA